GAWRKEPFRFERVVRLGPYEGLLQEVILRMKYASGEGLGEVLGELWASHQEHRLRELQADVVVPVPLYWLRRWQRGYNQSEVLAWAVAGRVGLPCRPRWLRRVRHTPKQTFLAPTARRENMRRAFRTTGRAAVQGRSVLLVDDVL